MNPDIIEATKGGDLKAVRELLAADIDVNAVDQDGWSALSWAAGRGILEIAAALINRGADVYHVGSDQRTPFKIAVAAGHIAVAELLRAEESKKGDDPQRMSSRDWENRPYCKAYPIEQLRKFEGWSDDQPTLPESIAFLHDNYVCTRSIWRDQDVLFDFGTPEGIRFCRDVLAFKAPDDIELASSCQTQSS